MLSIIASEIVTVQFPNIIGSFTDALSRGALTRYSVAGYAVLLLAVGIGYVVLYGIGQFINGRVGREFEYQLRERLFAHWETLSTQYYRTRSVGDLLNHALNDVRTVREALSGGMNILTNSVFLLIAALFMTFRTVSVKLTLISIIPMLFIPLFVIWWGPKIRDASRSVQEALSDMSDLTEESLSAIRLIKATANEHVEAARFGQVIDQIVRRQLAMVVRGAVFQSFIPVLGSLSFAIALIVGGDMTIHHEIELGAFVAFTLYLGMIITPLQQIGNVINNFQRASASLTRLSILLCERPEIFDAPDATVLDVSQGDIEVRLPHYSYPDGDRPVLSDIYMTVRRGETIGIVGRTGSGKTTLANLLPRLFEPPEAAIYIGGHDIRSLKLTALRAAIAYVPQDGFLFSTTVGNNIGFAKEAASEFEIRQAAEDAQIWEEILNFKKGLQTQIGERGVTLSGGQKQRTAIARAFLKDAEILIMDDSLSAVDMKTEKAIIERLKEIRRGKTTWIIAHRLSAVAHADQIFVLDDGRLVESGTHQQLIEQNGIYADMYARQQSSQEVGA